MENYPEFKELNEPWHEISNNVVYVIASKASDQPADMQPLLVAWIFYDC